MLSSLVTASSQGCRGSGVRSGPFSVGSPETPAEREGEHRAGWGRGMDPGSPEARARGADPVCARTPGMRESGSGGREGRK